MKSKDQILLEQAYKKVLNEQEKQLSKFVSNDIAKVVSKLDFEKLDNEDFVKIALKNPAIIDHMRDWIFQLVDSGIYGDDPTDDDVRALSPEIVVRFVKNEIGGNLADYFSLLR
jgi:hypothetical protein